MPDNSVDSLVTDPPAGIAFMGKDWDTDKGGSKEWIRWMEQVMRECMRVIKPGSHGLVWALPRTSHWTAMSLEWAGFEIRDCVFHIFGQGFPKSMDVSKTIDKAAGAKREVVGLAVNSYADSGRKDMHRKGGGKVFDQGEGVGQNVITAPVTDAAKNWQGWGTALKPAVECWWLVQKPLSENNVVENVLKWGTGALNIDASRIAGGARLLREMDRRPMGNSTYQGSRDGSTSGSKAVGDTTQGRFPANLVFSHTPYCTDAQCDIECAVLALDGQSGTSKATQTKVSDNRFDKNGRTLGAGLGRHDALNPYVDVGGASRFFYCAKISKSERNAGVEGVKGRSDYRPNDDGSKGLQSRLHGATEREGNFHPTVKPKKLMQYLIRLITPPNGRVLDPFMGSGSTGCAAVNLGFEFVGVERETDYFKIAQKRIEHAFSSMNECIPPQSSDVGEPPALCAHAGDDKRESDNPQPGGKSRPAKTSRRAGRNLPKPGTDVPSA